MDFRYQLINPWVPDTKSYTTFCHSKVFLQHFTKQLNYATLVELDPMYLELEFTVANFLIWSLKKYGTINLQYRMPLYGH